MKVCQNCQKKYPDNSQHCPNCGESLTPEGAGSNSGGSDDLVGRVFFGEYTITDQLGEGGMGAVYLAQQNAIDQKIALKVLHAESAESDEIIQRFHREARVISMLSHPNIVRVFIFGRTDDDLLFLAMEHVEGIELRERLDGTPIDELKAIKIMKQICSAVAEAHDLGIIHRDLKPENVLLTEFRGDENFVKILDFGIAKIKHPDADQGPQLTQAGIVYGTPEYLSPEQAQAHDLDNRTDIYALGCMLFEMLTGRVPFQASSSVEILKQKVFEDPPRASEFAQVAPTMDQIIRKAMAKDREDRFSDALDMFDALDVREKEIQSEQHLDNRQTSFPGSELTGVHRAVGAETPQGQPQSTPEPSSPPAPSQQPQPQQSPQQANAGQQAQANPYSADTDPDGFSGDEFDAKTITMEAPEEGPQAAHGQQAQSAASGEPAGGSATPDGSQQGAATGFQGNPRAGRSTPSQNQGPQQANSHPQQQNAGGRRNRPTPAARNGSNGASSRRASQMQGPTAEAAQPEQAANQPPARQGGAQPRQQNSGESIERYLLIGGVIGAGIILVVLLAYLGWRLFVAG